MYKRRVKQLDGGKTTKRAKNGTKSVAASVDASKEVSFMRFRVSFMCELRKYGAIGLSFVQLASALLTLLQPSTGVKYTNKQRVLVFSTRGITARYRHLMEDFKKLIPHHKKESKVGRN